MKLLRPLIRFALALLASAVVAHGGTSVEESPVFAFDTRDANGTTVAESAVFVFDTRAPNGLSSSAVSFAFPFDTRGAGLVSLTISGEAFVNVGPEYAYTVTAHFSDGSDHDVTTEVRWSDSGWPRHLIRTDGTLAIWFDDPTDRPLTIRAQYVRPERALTAEFQVTRGFSPDMHVFLNNPRGPTFLRPDGANYVWTLTTQVGNVLNANGAVSYTWSLDDSPIAGATAAMLNAEITGQPGTRTLQVRATDAHGHVATATRMVVFNRPGLHELGERFPAQDPSKGTFIDSLGNDFAFDLNKVDHGLIVLTHGLRGKKTDQWLRDLGNAIEARLRDEGKPVPNIAMFIWEEGAEPALHYGEGDDDEGFLANLLQVNRSVLQSKLFLPGIRNFMFDIGIIRPEGLHYGEVLADWVKSEIDASHISASAPIHFIGHSAGGFVVGEAAKLLKGLNPPVDVTQVTMLDTPLPVLSHFKDTPQPPPVERYVSSYFGAIAPLVDVRVFESANYHYRALSSLHPLAGTLVPTVTAHSYSHDWYWETVGDERNSERDGFYYSPFLGNHWSSSGGEASLRSLKKISVANSQQLTDFATFGNVLTNGAEHVIREAGNSGLAKEMTLPVGATALKLQYQFTTPGDGDFLAVYFGDNPPIYIGSDLPLTRSAPLAIEIPLLPYAGQTGTLVIKLVSRGNTNAVLAVDQISLTIDDDPDGDGLTNAGENALGTNPLLRDTDGDDLDDNYEVNVSLTNPLLTDSDNDGASDRLEEMAGTDPLSTVSVFVLKKIVRNEDDRVTLRWQAQNGKAYRVLRSATVDFANFDVIASGIPGSVPFTSFTGVSIGGGGFTNAFYRVALDSN